MPRQPSGGVSVAEVETSVEVAASPEQVWSVVTDPSRLGEWQQPHLGFVGEAPSALDAGTGFQQRVTVMGMPNEIAWTVAAAEAPATLVLRGTGPMNIQVGNTYSLAPSGSGTTLTLAYSFTGAVLAAVEGQLTRAAKAEQEASLAQLKALVEG